MKGIPRKIFISMLTAGLIAIMSEIVLKYDIDRLSENYAEITEEHSVNIDYMHEISGLLYKHQSLAANHVTAKDESVYEDFEEQMKVIEGELDGLLKELSERMEGDDGREQLFHDVYSNYYSYLRNTEVALKFSRSGSTETAAYYTINIMGGFVETVNGNLDKLNELTLGEMREARERMSWYVRFSHLCANVCMAVIAVSVIICTVYCSKITGNLDRYKDSLEKEVEQKTGDLRRHSEKMIELQNNIIIGMANLIESRDGDTGEHVKRTSKYVSMLATAARENGLYQETLTDGYIELLVKAAPMHDIGKIAVPDSILQKPGRLTPEEFEKIKDHAAQGGKIIREVLGSIEQKEYVEIAATVASCHHEKWDGSGYPEGLRGEEIPLCARIMAIADVFDALISKRCYKSAMTLDEAFGIINDSSGSHFDPALASVFVWLRPEIEDYLNSEHKK